MARKKVVSSKEVVKPNKEVKQRLVHQRNIDRRLKEGWEIVKKDATDKHGRILGVRIHTSELVLMEKEK